jgi:hypothetical protein
MEYTRGKGLPGAQYQGVQLLSGAWSEGALQFLGVVMRGGGGGGA